jgi:transposase
MPAKDVKAYVNGNKNDAADAEAICEAVRRPTRAQIAELGIVFPQGREGLEELLKIIAR